MEFKVSRTSHRLYSDLGEDPGLEEAERRVENDKEYWVINLSSLEELLEFVEKQGGIILFRGNSIEIYDARRE